MILIELNKKRAISKIIFEENIKMDNNDKWFIDVKKIKNKTGKLMSISTILRKDIDTWINIYKKEGWDIVKNKLKQNGR